MARAYCGNFENELKKAARGQKTVMPPELLVYICLENWGYRGIARKVKRAFAITGD